MALYHSGMNLPRDVAAIRLDNTLLLFEEFVQATVRHPDAATLRGLEGRFAERLRIQPSYWSQIKSRSRQIGERLARQFEQCCHKPAYWMDQVHAAAEPVPEASVDAAQPLDEDERFIVGLVLTYYRRHPQRARARLMDLLGEVLTPPDEARPTAARPAPNHPAPRPRAALAPADDTQSLWQQAQRGVAPLKPKR
jgi:hypothetical protein